MILILRGYYPNRCNGKQKYISYLFKGKNYKNIFHNWNVLNLIYPKTTYLFKNFDVYLFFSLKIFFVLFYYIYLKKEKNISIIIDSQANIFLMGIVKRFSIKDISLIFYDFGTKDKNLNARDKKYLKNIDHIIVMTNAMKKELLNKIKNIKPQTIKVKYYKVNKKNYYVKNKKDQKLFKTKSELPDNYILYVGSEQKRKNLFTLVNAFKKIQEVFPNLYFIKIGEDQDIINRRKLKKIVINDEKLKNRFWIIEKCSEFELASYYNYAKIFIFPSVYEGFGIPLVEAMACGCPIIASKISTTLEICNNNIIYINDFYNDNHFAEKIVKLLKDKTFYNKMKSQSIQRAKNFIY